MRCQNRTLEMSLFGGNAWFSYGQVDTHITLVTSVSILTAAIREFVCAKKAIKTTRENNSTRCKRNPEAKDSAAAKKAIRISRENKSRNVTKTGIIIIGASSRSSRKTLQKTSWKTSKRNLGAKSWATAKKSIKVLRETAKSIKRIDVLSVGNGSELGGVRDRFRLFHYIFGNSKAEMEPDFGLLPGVISCQAYILCAMHESFSHGYSLSLR